MFYNPLQLLPHCQTIVQHVWVRSLHCAYAVPSVSLPVLHETLRAVHLHELCGKQALHLHVLCTTSTTGWVLFFWCTPHWNWCSRCDTCARCETLYACTVFNCDLPSAPSHKLYARTVFNRDLPSAPSHTHTVCTYSVQLRLAQRAITHTVCTYSVQLRLAQRAITQTHTVCTYSVQLRLAQRAITDTCYTANPFGPSAGRAII